MKEASHVSIKCSITVKGETYSLDMNMIEPHSQESFDNCAKTLMRSMRNIMAKYELIPWPKPIKINDDRWYEFTLAVFNDTGKKVKQDSDELINKYCTWRYEQAERDDIQLRKKEADFDKGVSLNAMGFKYKYITEDDNANMVPYLAISINDSAYFDVKIIQEAVTGMTPELLKDSCGEDKMAGKSDKNVGDYVYFMHANSIATAQVKTKTTIESMDRPTDIQYGFYDDHAGCITNGIRPSGDLFKTKQELLDSLAQGVD